MRTTKKPAAKAQSPGPSREAMAIARRVNALPAVAQKELARVASAPDTVPVRRFALEDFADRSRQLESALYIIADRSTDDERGALKMAEAHAARLASELRALLGEEAQP